MTPELSLFLNDFQQQIDWVCGLLPYDLCTVTLRSALMAKAEAFGTRARKLAVGEECVVSQLDDTFHMRYEAWAENIPSILRKSIGGLPAGNPHAVSGLCQVQELVALASGVRRMIWRAEEEFERLSRRPGDSDLADSLRRQSMVYNNIPAFEATMLTDRLLVGRNPLTKRDVLWLQDMGVNHFVDLREPWEWQAPGRLGAEAVRALPQRYEIPIHQDTAGPLAHAVAYIDHMMAGDHVVLYVFDRAGRGRAAAVLTAWLAHKYGFTYDKALRELQARRPQLQPNPQQENAVRQWLRAVSKH